MDKNTITKANEIAELMNLSEAVGSAAQVRTSGEVYLVSTSQTEPQRIGGTVAEAVAYLKRLAAPSSTTVHATAS